MTRPTIECTAPTPTPWGNADFRTEYAPGITFFSTPRHGGFFLSLKRCWEMPPHLRAIPTFTGLRQWFEEDCDWALVALAFPDVFPDCQAEARAMFNQYHAHKAPAQGQLL